jgi:aryl-alcohol dehydrogenase-like predicted oxidoreductase
MMLSKTKLGTTDLEVSQLCYGTNMLGTAIDQGAANAILDTFVAQGGNFLDTARSYGDWVPDAPAGASERAIGAWLKGRNRADVVIATKGAQFDMRVGDWRNRVTPADIAQDLTESLDHLGVDTIDLYWLHADNPQAPVQPIIDALLDHQQARRIRWFGASNWAPDRIREANAYAQSIGKNGFVASQPFWGLAVPDREAAAAQGYQLYYEEGYQSLHAEGLPMIPYAAQSGGYFTKIEQGGEEAVPEGLRARYGNPANKGRFAAAKALAEKKGVTINEVVLAYLVDQPNQTIPIFGGRSPEQIEETVKAVSLRLPPEELEQLRAG